MSFVAVFMTATTAFVLLAPLAMAVILVTGGVRTRQPVAAAATTDACGCAAGRCECRAELRVAA